MRFVNKYQSKEERKAKYRFCREAGLPYWIARELRDWRMTKIKLFIESVDAHKEFVNCKGGDKK